MSNNELELESKPTPPELILSKKRLFNMDLHISVIADVETIFRNLYGDNIEIVNWSLSGHSHILNKAKVIPDVINHTNWRNINPTMIQNFQQRYYTYLSQFDGFIVTHTPIFALLYSYFDKPIFLVNSCRYEQPFSWLEGGNSIEMWNYLNRQLAELYFIGKLIPVSNNRADRDYLQLGCGIESIHIPSLCYYTNAKWTGIKNQFIVFDSSNIIPNNMIPNLYRKESLGNNYSWSHLYQYKAIVHIPYECSTMSIFEQYTANVPLFFPTKNFLKQLIQMNRIKFNSRYAYHHSHNNKRIMYPNEIDIAYNNSTWIDFWLDRADYYDEENMKYIIYFDSIPHLTHLLRTTNFDEVSHKMAEWNIERELEIHTKWKDILDEHLYKL